MGRKPLTSRAPRTLAAQGAFYVVLLILVPMGVFAAVSMIAGIFSTEAGSATMALVWLPTFVLACGYLPPVAFGAIGRETLGIEGDDFVIERRLLGFTRSMRIDLAAIKNLRVRRGTEDLRPRVRRRIAWSWPLITPLEGMRRRRVLFDYGAATVDCGVFLDEADGEAVAAALALTGAALATQA